MKPLDLGCGAGTLAVFGYGDLHPYHAAMRRSGGQVLGLAHLGPDPSHSSLTPEKNVRTAGLVHGLLLESVLEKREMK